MYQSMDFNRNLRIVRTSGPSYPFPYKSNVLWVHHDENNNPIVEIWDHGKWVPVTVVGSGSGDIIIDTKCLIHRQTLSPIKP